MTDVPSSELGARLEVVEGGAVAGGMLEYVVVSTGEHPVVFGAVYELDRLADDGWEAVPVPYAFRAWARCVDSGDRHELTARVPELAPPGRYRLRKHVKVDRNADPGHGWAAAGEEIEVTAEFEVTSG